MPEKKAYVGSKIIHAYPEEKDGQPGYAVIYPDGYQSWSPKETFEKCYREISHDEAVIASGNMLMSREQAEGGNG